MAIGLMIVGVFQIANFFINSTQYEQYPARYAQENCDNPYLFAPKGPTPAALPAEATPSAQEIQAQKKQCEQTLALDRKQHKLDDLKNAILFPLIGLILFGIHFPLAKKYSK